MQLSKIKKLLPVTCMREADIKVFYKTSTQMPAHLYFKNRLINLYLIV